MASGGSVFDINKWIPRKPIQVKKFLSVLGERVALSAAPPKCQECHCLKGDIGEAAPPPTCWKCFGSSLYLGTLTDRAAARDNAKGSISVNEDIKANFIEVFLKDNSNSTRML